MRINKDTIDQFFDSDLHLPSRTLYIGDTVDAGAVDAIIASRVIKALHLLEMQNSNAVKVLLNSMGGCVHNGFAIYDALHDFKCHVTIEVLGSAMSMGSIILQAADERLMHKNATIMLHEYSVDMAHKSRDFENWADWLKIQRRKMHELFAAKTGRTPAYWAKRCGNDFILSAEQALEERLIDRIIG